MAKIAARPPGYWAGVKDDYMAGEKLPDILARHGCTKGEFDHHRREAGWPMRHHAKINRERLIGRIFWLINRHLAAMEKNMDAGSHTDVAVLNQLVGSLGRLIRLEAGSAKPVASRKPAAELQDIREKLVRRIAELKRG